MGPCTGHRRPWARWRGPRTGSTGPTGPRPWLSPDSGAWCRPWASSTRILLSPLHPHPQADGEWVKGRWRAAGAGSGHAPTTPVPGARAPGPGICSSGGSGAQPSPGSPCGPQRRTPAWCCGHGSSGPAAQKGRSWPCGTRPGGWAELGAASLRGPVSAGHWSLEGAGGKVTQRPLRRAGVRGAWQEWTALVCAGASACAGSVHVCGHGHARVCARVCLHGHVSVQVRMCESATACLCTCAYAVCTCIRVHARVHSAHACTVGGVCAHA